MRVFLLLRGAEWRDFGDTITVIRWHSDLLVGMEKGSGSLLRVPVHAPQPTALWVHPARRPPGGPVGTWGPGVWEHLCKPALASTDTATPQRQAWPPCPPALGAASGLVFVSSSLPTGSLRTAWAPEAG